MTGMVNPDRARSRTFVVTGAASGIGQQPPVSPGEARCTCWTEPNGTG